MTRRLLLVLVLALAAAPRPAAAEERAAVVDLVITGDAAPEVRGSIVKSLTGGLFAGGFSVVAAEEVAAALRGARELQGCVTTTCLARLGERLKATQFVRLRLDAEGKTYSASLELYTAAAGLVRRVERTCAVCTLNEANDMVSAAAAALVLPPVRVLVRVTSDPAGAAVSVDEREVGAAPLEVELEPGEHRFGAALPGHARAERAVLVSAGPAVDVALVLAADAVPLPAAAPPAPPVAAERRPLPWKWIAAGSGAALLTTGVVLLALDGSCAGDPLGPGVPCADLYDTSTGGWLLTVAGLAAGGAAAYLFLQPRLPAFLALAPAPGGVAAVATVRF